MIRPATLDDLDALVAIEERCFDSDRLSRRSFRHLLTRGRAITLVIERDGRLCGYSMALCNTGTSLGRLYSFAVDPGCRGYRYLSLGYYCSLLAEARRHRVIPAMRTITDLSAKAIYSLGAEDLDAQVHRSLSRRVAREAGRSAFEMDIYFGRCADEALQDLAEEIFDLFPCPLLRVQFEHDRKWRISTIRPLTLPAVPAERHELFVAAFETHGHLEKPFNDNPNVDPGVEDAVLDDRLYELILGDLVRRLDERRTR